MENKNNEFYLSFCELVEEQKQQEQKNSYDRSRLYRLLPEPFYKTVEWHIRTRFHNDIEAYCQSIPLFFQLWTANDKAICEDRVIYSRKRDRKKNKIRKHALLHCAFLLKLTGRNGQKIVPKLILQEYLDDQAQQEEFCRNTRLMDYTGRLAKLTSPTSRREQRSAQNYNVAKLFDHLMVEKQFTFAFITITLPPEYHPNPIKGRNSYSGASPQEMLKKLSYFIELLRAHLAKAGLKVGDDFFGIHVLEGHSDGCPHKHMMIYIAEENLSLLKGIVDGIVLRERQSIAKELSLDIKKVKYAWDFKVNDGSAKSHTYLYKYICPDLNDKETAKNEAFRSYAGGRAVQFFGVRNKISTFNHLMKHWKNYAMVIENKEVLEMLANKDLVAFHTKFADKFNNVNVNKKFIGVAYQETPEKLILIEKKQFVLIEEYCKDKSVISHPQAMEKQKNFNELLLDYYAKQFNKGVDVFIPIAECFYSQSSSKVIKEYFDEQLELGKSLFARSLEEPSDLDKLLNMEVILVHHYSSKLPSAICGWEKPPAKAVQNDKLVELTT